MEGKTNQVKIMLEEQLLVLSDIVIMEEFWNGTNSSELTEVRRKTARRERELIVKEATLATVDSVEDVECPGLWSDCLNFNNTIVLFMVDEVDVEEKVDIFEAAMLAKISDGWLVDNFDLEKALQPPPAPTPPPNRIDSGTGGNETIDSSQKDDDDCASSCYKIASSGLRLTSSKMEECLRTNCGASRLDDIDMVEVASTKRERDKKSDTDDNEVDCVSKCTDSKKKRASKAGNDDMEKCLTECASDGGTCKASCPTDEEDKRGNKKSMKREKKGEETGKASDCMKYCETCEFNCLKNKMAPGDCVCKYPAENNEKNVDVVLTSY